MRTFGDTLVTMYDYEELNEQLKGTRSQRDAVFAILTDSYTDSGSDNITRIETVDLINTAWALANGIDGTSYERSAVKGFVAGIFYIHSEIAPLYYQLLPAELHGWAYFGNRIGQSVNSHTTPALIPDLRRRFVDIDIALLRQGDQLENLRAFCLCVKPTSYLPNEFIGKNNWLKAMGSHALGLPISTPPDCGYSSMGAWFPAYNEHLETAAALELGFEDIVSMIVPETVQDVSLPNNLDA